MWPILGPHKRSQPLVWGSPDGRLGVVRLDTGALVAIAESDVTRPAGSGFVVRLPRTPPDDRDEGCQMVTACPHGQVASSAGPDAIWGDGSWVDRDGATTPAPEGFHLISGYNMA